MVDGVAAAGLRLLLEVHLEFFRRRSRLLERSEKTEETRIEGRDVLPQHFRRVARRIHRHDEHLHTLGVGTELLRDSGELREGGRTRIGTVRKAEEHHYDFAFEVFEGTALPVVVGQIELAAE